MPVAEKGHFGIEYSLRISGCIPCLFGDILDDRERFGVNPQDAAIYRHVPRAVRGSGKSMVLGIQKDVEASGIKHVAGGKARRSAFGWGKTFRAACTCRRRKGRVEKRKAECCKK